MLTTRKRSRTDCEEEAQEGLGSMDLSGDLSENLGSRSFSKSLNALSPDELSMARTMAMDKLSQTLFLEPLDFVDLLPNKRPLGALHDALRGASRGNKLSGSDTHMQDESLESMETLCPRIEEHPSLGSAHSIPPLDGKPPLPPSSQENTAARLNDNFAIRAPSHLTYLCRYLIALPCLPHNLFDLSGDAVKLENMKSLLDAQGIQMLLQSVQETDTIEMAALLVHFLENLGGFWPQPIIPILKSAFCSLINSQASLHSIKSLESDLHQQTLACGHPRILHAHS